tara:strand:+ start:51 stop:527 length:477 start_codon:yes stop_codon:yes gene_type:complete
MAERSGTVSSSDRLNPQQLRMFIPAGELKDMVYPPDVNQEKYADLVPDVGRKMMWADKLAEAKTPLPKPSGWMDQRLQHMILGVPHGAGLHESIQAEGVQTPVPLIDRDDEEPILFEGHHRVAAAADIDPKMEVPIEHLSMGEARKRDEARRGELPIV